MPATSNGGDSCHTEANSQASELSQHQLQTGTSTSSLHSRGYYDADKCRAYIASRIKINKIARFATQVNRVIEIENSIQVQLETLLSVYLHRVAIKARELQLRYNKNKPAAIEMKMKRKPGRPSKRKMMIGGVGETKPAHRSETMNHRKHHLLKCVKDEHIRKPPIKCEEGEGEAEDDMKVEDELVEFEPNLYMSRLEQCFEYNMDKSRCITSQLNLIRQMFEKMASDHRDKVDVVHAIEEERQGTSVVRRSTYNLSIAANRATSIPVRVAADHLPDSTSQRF